MSFAPPSDIHGLRRAPRESDVEAIAAVVRATGAFNESEVGIAQELIAECLARGEQASGYSFIFADGPDGIDGYVCFGEIPGTNKRFELYWIAVHPGTARSGLGRRLQLAAEEVARGWGGLYMMAETSTREDYERARAFYRALGYEKKADIPDYHDDGDGLAVFVKKL